MTESEKIGETISSLVDGELTGAEFEHTVTAMTRSAELKQCWARYHVAADAMKNTLPPVMVKGDFADRVMQAIDSEPTVLAPRRFSPRLIPVTKQIAGLAVAASVTAVTVLGVQAWNHDGAMPTQVAQTPAPIPAQAAAAAVAKDQAPLPAHIQSQITHYLVTHNQNTVAVHGMLPYARIVGYSPGETAE